MSTPPNALNSPPERELLAVVLGAEGAQTAEALLSRYGDLHGLRRASPLELEGEFGVAAPRAAALLAALELGWRMVATRFEPGEIYRSSEQVYRAFRAPLESERVEVVWLVLLDARLRKLGAQEISRGSVAGAVVHPREILRPVITQGASAFLLLHNHPSGDPEPSASDLRLTRNVAAAATLLQVDFLDHLIIGRNCYCSLADRRLL